MSVKQKEKGFTIIEVVLVLAIAGLIFMMVFVALPGLQRAQRDTQRKNDMSRVMTQISSYSSNNRGAIPGSLILPATGNFVYGYLGGGSVAGAVAGAEYLEPSTGTGYLFAAANTAIPGAPALGTIYYNTSAECDVDGAITGSTARKFTLRTKLEGQTAMYCLDNR